MKLTVRRLKEIISYHWGGHDMSLIDDESFGKTSVLVPDDIKDDVKRWARHMKLGVQYNLDREVHNDKTAKKSR